jgi:hypothetical protein
MKGEAKLAYLLSALFFQGIAFCLLLSFSLINLESTFLLLVFNLLFISLTFPLEGKLWRKTCLLFVGNVIGLFWNYLLYLLASIGVGFFGEFFNALYLLLDPFVNLMWIVSFWSISLTALANSENGRLVIYSDD